MTTFNYPRSAKTANRLIKKFGFNTTILREVKGVYDPVEGEFASNTEISTKARVVLLPPKASSNGEYSDLYKGEDGTINVDECGFILISPLGLTFEPTVTDYVLIRGEKWILNGLTKLRPDGSTMVLYKGPTKRI